MSANLLGKIALITGAGSGLGRASCQVLAREGAKVIAADMNFESVKQTISNLSHEGHLATKIDVSDRNSIKQCLESILKQFKQPPSVIVNCAGITRDNFLLKLSEEDFDEVIKVNLKGTFSVVQLFAQSIVENKIKNASIINFASISGRSGNIGQCNYAASKAGVELLTKTAAKELAQFGIRCNTVFPGFIETPMTDAVPEKVKAKIVPLIPLQRMGRPEEVAELVAFLASDKSSYITGASIDITGGLTI